MAAPVTNLPAERLSVGVTMARKYSMEAKPFEATVRAICLPPDRDGRQATPEEFAAFLLVAMQYDLNPLCKEIFGFRGKNGAIVPVVSVDGWANIINRRPELDGIEFDDHVEGNNLTAITARIWRKDRSKPTVVTEYMAECRRDPDKTPWGKWPRRMLRHKALIQCARYAFALSGIVDPDEAERMGADVSPMPDVTPTKEPGVNMVPVRDAGPPMPFVPTAPPADDGLDIPASLRSEQPKPQPAEIDEPPADPEKMLKWIDTVLAEVVDPDTLQSTWNFRVEPHLGNMFPPDQEEAMGIYRKHEARLAP